MTVNAPPRKRRHLHRAVARYREARKTLHTPASPQSRYGLDWMNFFLADVQTGFGTFVAFYLAHLGWTERNVGFALTLGGFIAIAAVASAATALIWIFIAETKPADYAK